MKKTCNSFFLYTKYETAAASQLFGHCFLTMELRILIKATRLIAIFFCSLKHYYKALNINLQRKYLEQCNVNERSDERPILIDLRL